MCPACPGLAHTSANQFKSAFISVELLAAAMLHCASVVGFGSLVEASTLSPRANPYVVCCI
jgi:hypothetical protein